MFRRKSLTGTGPRPDSTRGYPLNPRPVLPRRRGHVEGRNERLAVEHQCAVDNIDHRRDGLDVRGSHTTLFGDDDDTP